MKILRSKSLAGAAATAAVAAAVIAGGAQASTEAGGTPGAPGLGDTVYPNLGNGGFQVDAYLIDMAYSAQTKLIDASVRLQATSSQDLSRFNLDAFGLDIRSVKVDGRNTSFTQEGEELTITPAKAIRRGAGFAVEVAYSADPARIKPPAGGFVVTADGFATAPQPAGAHTVFPSNDHPSDKAYYVFRVTAPAGTTGVATGAKAGTRTNPDGSTTSTYISAHPLATELVQISVGDYTVVDRGRHGGTRLRDVVPTARLPKLEPSLALTTGQLDWLSKHLGRFPLEAYGLLPANTDAPDAFDFTGLETQTLTIYKPNYLLQAEDKIGSHMMHELVHNWFGNSVTPKDWGDLWLNEGHADFYGLIYRYERGWPDSRGYTTLEQRMKYTYSQGDLWRKSSGPVAKPNAQNLFDNQRYTGGVLVLYALRNKVGEDAFKRIEQALIERYRDRTVGTADFIELAASVSGDPSVKPFLTDWLYGAKTPPMPGHPDWTVDPAPTQLQRSDLDVQYDRRHLGG